MLLLCSLLLQDCSLCILVWFSNQYSADKKKNTTQLYFTTDFYNAAGLAERVTGLEMVLVSFLHRLKIEIFDLVSFWHLCLHLQKTDNIIQICFAVWIKAIKNKTTYWPEWTILSQGTISSLFSLRPYRSESQKARDVHVQQMYVKLKEWVSTVTQNIFLFHCVLETEDWT